jgi:predicted glutamine amidotransferase
LEAPDSLATQSRREPDGTGLGTFDVAGTPRVDKAPIAAYQDQQFAQEAKERLSSTFIAHIRYASTGGLRPENTHPFEHRRIFAHNGVIDDLPRLETELGDYRSLVRGDTDFERFFALITRHIDAHRGDIGAGITSAARWTAANQPLYAINMVLTTPQELFALRYPDTHDLFVLHRAAGGPRPSTTPAESASAPPHWPPPPRSWSPANAWTTIPTGARCRPGNYSTSTATSPSTPPPPSNTRLPINSPSPTWATTPHPKIKHDRTDTASSDGRCGLLHRGLS